LRSAFIIPPFEAPRFRLKTENWQLHTAAGFAVGTVSSSRAA
jgi:hypothetical protein